MKDNRRKIMDALSRRPFHRLVRNDVYNISERIKDIEPDYFILKNTVNGRYEVHSTANIGDTYCFTVQEDRLDYRTLRHCRETSNGQNMMEVYDRMNDRLDSRRIKHNRDNIHDMAEELAERMIIATDSDMLSEGYSKYHVI